MFFEEIDQRIRTIVGDNREAKGLCWLLYRQYDEPALELLESLRLEPEKLLELFRVTCKSNSAQFWKALCDLTPERSE